MISRLPINPSSSAIIEKMKSLYPSGRKKSFCELLPNPPPNDTNDCISGTQFLEGPHKGPRKT